VKLAHTLILGIALLAAASTAEGKEWVIHTGTLVDGVAELMNAQGTYLVPTLTVYELYYVAARDHPELLTPGTAAKELANDPLQKKNLPLAIKSGVKIAYGTDTGQGDHGLEFGLLIANGMTPAQALLAATRNAADLLGAADRVGSVQAGRYADLVATARNPLEHPEQFQQVSFVMKGGRINRREGLEVVPAAC
jgi:imidazolonepropionase-like amidohydrolase